MRRHTIQASDEEWALIKAYAESSGMNTSQFVIACGLADDLPGGEGYLSADEQREMYNSVKSLVAFHDDLNSSVFEVSRLSRDNINFETYQLNLQGLIHSIFLMAGGTFGDLDSAGRKIDRT